jgi:hypothetical protein
MSFFRKKENKIIIRFFGGLGNQLFIFAFSKSLSLSSNSLLFIDNYSGFIYDSYKRKYLLNNFLIRIPRINIFLLFYFKFLNKYKIISNKVIFIKEKDSRCIESSLLNFNPTATVTFFEGYWQSYKYFNKYSDQIRNSLNIDNLPVSIEVKLQALKIKNTESVAIHVRRLEYEDKLNINYYHNAIDLFKNLKFIKFYIFSDDIEWCKLNFSSNEFVFITNNSEIEDFYLMTKCNSFIIANSSFSWWAAWLSESESKKVIAPKNTSIGCVNNFYPNDWILIDN